MSVLSSYIKLSHFEVLLTISMYYNYDYYGTIIMDIYIYIYEA
jgi:hypothetical protein